jgi:hypothetical protein
LCDSGRFDEIAERGAARKGCDLFVQEEKLVTIPLVQNNHN